MGMIFQRLVGNMPRAQGTMMLEIGSDRHEGSTMCLADLALQQEISLYSIDIDTAAASRVKHSAIVWQKDVGSDWCRDVLPTLGKKISVLYLDNFDYIWDVNEYNASIAQQQQQYISKFGLVMNNQNCQIEHMKQMIYCLPYMADHSVVMCDDTYLSNDCWVGKCGGVVIWLLAQGWHLSLVRDCGVILTSPGYEVTINS
jgi:hypothetical protein